MIVSIHHFSVIVSSEESVEFYEKLGFREYHRIERKHDTVVLMNGHGIGLEMFVDASHAPRSNPEPLGMRNVSLRVDKVENTANELGLNIGPVMTDWTGVKFAFVTDPDGNVIQLHE